MVQQAVMARDELKQALAELPRVPLAATPTPLEECSRLSQARGGPESKRPFKVFTPAPIGRYTKDASWRLERGGTTRSHSEHGSETP